MTETLDRLEALGYRLGVVRQRERLIADLYQETINLCPCAAVVCDQAERFVVWNRRAAELIGAPVETVTLDAYVTEEMPFRVCRPSGAEYALTDYPIKRALRGEVVTGERMVLVWPDRQLVVLVNAAPIRFSDEVIGAGVTFLPESQHRDCA